MTFIESADSSPVSQYMGGRLNFFAPFYWKTGDGFTTDADFPTSKSYIRQIGSEYVNGIAYSLYKSISVGYDEYDWFDTTNRVPPYYDDSNGYISAIVTPNAVRTMYRNIVSDRFFKEGIIVGKDIDIVIGLNSSMTYFTSKRIRFIASLIDSSGTKTAIGTSAWVSITSANQTITTSITSSGIETVGTDKKLFIEMQYEATHDSSSSSNSLYLYNYYITSSGNYTKGVFISCSAE